VVLVGLALDVQEQLFLVSMEHLVLKNLMKVVFLFRLVEIVHVELPHKG
jgi:hypothetical protein